MSKYHLAQINIARMLAAIDDAMMADFVGNLPTIHTQAEQSPGFVWRLQSDSGDATSIKVYHDDMIIINLTVWENPESLRAFVYKSDHYGFLRERKRWFRKFDGPYYAMWWVAAGHIPTTEEAKERLEHLREHGDSSYSFSFKNLFPEPSEVA